MSSKPIGENCNGNCENCDLNKIHNAETYVINIEVGVSTKEKMQQLMDYIGKYIDGNDNYKEVTVRLIGRRVRRMPVKGPNIIAVTSLLELEEVLKNIVDIDSTEPVREFLERNK